MEDLGWIGTVVCLTLGAGISVVVNRYLKYGFLVWFFVIVFLAMVNSLLYGWDSLWIGSLSLWLPLLFVHGIMYGLVDYHKDSNKASKVFEVRLKVRGRNLVLGNIRRGVSVMASAGSGKTESVIYGLLGHFQQEGFSGGHP